MKVPQIHSFLLLATALAPAGCASIPPDTISQFATLPAAERGRADLGVGLATALAQGKTGVALTTDRRSVALLNGKAYAFQRDGTARPAPLDTPLAWAATAAFKWDTVLTVRARSSGEDIAAMVNQALPDPERFCVFTLAGHLLDAEVESKTLADEPLVRQLQDVSGTIVGLRLPAPGANPFGARFLMVLLSDNRQYGGLLRSCTVQSGMIELDECNRMITILPPR